MVIGFVVISMATRLVEVGKEDVTILANERVACSRVSVIGDELKKGRARENMRGDEG